MSRIRKEAKKVGHVVIGKLTRVPEREYRLDCAGNRVHCGSQFYVDTAGNEYWVSGDGVSIVAADGAIVA